MAKRNEYLVVVMVEPAPAGEFIEWPLHITVVPWFHADDENKLDKFLCAAASRNKSFEAVVGQQEFFGFKKDLVVNVLKDQKDIQKLHWSIFRALEHNGFSVHQKDFTGTKYRAHITHQPHGFKVEGNRIKILSYVLVKQIRPKKTGLMVKSVLKEYKLDG